MSSQRIFQILPLFRQELKLYKGPDEADGSPTYNLHDPIKGQYYKLGWKESLVIKCLRPGMTPDDLAAEMNRISTIRVDGDDVDYIFFQCASMGLLRIPKGSEYYEERQQAGQSNIWSWILQHYLYIRIPLLNPDLFLKKTLPYVRFLGSKWMFVLYTFLTLFGLYLMFGRFDEFLNTFTYFFNFQGFLIYALAITSVKFIHEFAHAYVGKRFGLHIPTMGIAFMLFWPVLYTDVTDGWKLSKRSQRISVSFAGVAAELIIAGISTLGWSLSSPGMLQSIFFVLATTGWISTLAINMNPAVRFDGYYILSDLLGIDNLQNRAFSLLRWKSYDLFFGIKTPIPEDNLKPTMVNALTIYAAYTYIYRIILYTTIALFVYFEFTKSLGIILLVAEVLIFILFPFIYELKELYKVKNLWNWNYRLLITYFLLGSLAVWFIFPLPHQDTYPAVIVPSRVQILYVPYDSTIQNIYATRNEYLKKGQPILDLSSKPLLKELGVALLQTKEIETEIRALSQDKADVNQLAEKQADLQRASDYLQELLSKKQSLEVKADLSGLLFAWDNDLRPGQTVAQGSILGKLADPKDKFAITFIPETHLNDLKLGQLVTIIEKEPYQKFSGEIETINPSRTLNLSYLNLASTNKGPLPVLQQTYSANPVIVESYFAVYVKIDDQDADNLSYGQLMEVQIKGEWYSKMMRLITFIRSVVIKESSL